MIKPRTFTLFWGVLYLLLTACGQLWPTPPPLPELPTQMPVAVVPVMPTATPFPLPTLRPSPTPGRLGLPTTPIPLPTSPVPLATATSWPTPDPYAGLTIADLQQRQYGQGELVVEQVLAETADFTRYLIHYPSDDLTIYGFMNVPTNQPGPLPVVVMVHGFVNPAEYETLDYTTGQADFLARAGFLVLHPNLRNYPPSDMGANDLRVGFAVDVLNLLALVQQQGGQPGALALADPGWVTLWGHSMGGGVALRVLVVARSVRAAVLYGAMSADEYANYQKIFEWTDGRTGQEELAIPAADMALIAPLDYLGEVSAAITIHHGTADTQVPLQWSADLCDRLRRLGKDVICYTYAGQPHYFVGDGDALFRQRVLDFLSPK